MGRINRDSLDKYTAKYEVYFEMYESVDEDGKYYQAYHDAKHLKPVETDAELEDMFLTGAIGVIDMETFGLEGENKAYFTMTAYMTVARNNPMMYTHMEMLMSLMGMTDTFNLVSLETANYIREQENED